MKAVSSLKAVAAASTLDGSASSTTTHKTTTTGKRTYADANLSPIHTEPNSIPLSLQRDPHRHRQRRRRLLTPYTSASTDSGHASVSRRLWSREIGESAPHPTILFAKERFSNLKLQSTLDSHDLTALTSKMSWLRTRSKIVEISSSDDLIFALTQNGVCVAFDRITRKRVCFLNITDDEVIRSLFLNKTNGCLITVSVFRKDDFSSLHCRSTPLVHIKKGYLKSGHAVFESESLKWPGFVEFDDVNCKILTFSAEHQRYSIWDLKTYKLLYTIADENIQEIKISPGVMLLIYHRQESHVPIRMLNVESGKKLKEINQLLNRKRKVDFIEQFHEKLLIKQEHENLQILDVYTGEQIEIERSHQLSPNAFIFLYESEMFLTFQQRQVIVWNFRGQRITDFEDHQLFRSDSNTNCIYITRHQDIILSYCQQVGNCRHGSINLSWINSGKLLGKITCASHNNNNNNSNRDDNDDNTENTKMNALQALEDVTALYYNEANNEIYSGSRDGLVHVWSN